MFKKEAGLNAFTLSPQKWINATNAIGIIAKSGCNRGTYAHKDIAFKSASWIFVYYRNRRFGNGGFGTEKLAEKIICFQKATGELSDSIVNIKGLSMSDMLKATHQLLMRNLPIFPGNIPSKVCCIFWKVVPVMKDDPDQTL